MSERRYGYFSAHSFFHQMDALSKFIWVFLSSMLAFVLWQPWQVAIQVAVLMIITISFSRRCLDNVVKAWVLFTFLGGCILFFHVLMRHEGALLWRWGIFVIHSDGLQKGLMYALRLMAIMGSSYVFVRTTNPRELVVGLIHLGVPYRYAWMVFLTMLTVPIFESEAVIVREAQLVRGVRPAANPLLERLSMAQRYVLPLLVSGLRRVENLAIAMDSRAFGAYPTRTFVDEFRWTRSGLLFMGVTTAAFLALLGLRFFWLR